MTELEPTRLSLHAVAELLVAGPQKRDSDTVRLQVVRGGFATVKDPAASVVDGLLDGVALDGRTVGDVAAEAGIAPFDLRQWHADFTSFTTDSVLTVDADAASVLTAAWCAGWDALAAFVPDAERVLWPEHFDVAATVEEMTFGVSPGDHFIGTPYAYVLPGTKDGLDDPYWNQPFGAASTLADLGGTADDVAAYFARGRELRG